MFELTLNGQPLSVEVVEAAQSSFWARFTAEHGSPVGWSEAECEAYNAEEDGFRFLWDVVMGRV